MPARLCPSRLAALFYYHPILPFRIRTEMSTPTSFDGLARPRTEPSERWWSSIRMAFIYEQQRWEGEIVNERDAEQRRGRPCKHYRVHWIDRGCSSYRLGLLQD